MADTYMSDLEAEVQRDLSISENFSKAVVRSVVNRIRAALLRDDKVHLPEIGTFYASHVKRYQTVTPKGVPVTVPAYRRVKFLASRKLRKELELPHAAQSGQTAHAQVC